MNDGDKFCPKCGKQIGISKTNVPNKPVKGELTKNGFRTVYLSTICLVVLYIITNLIVEMVKYTEKGFSYDEVNNKVMAHAYGLIVAIIIFTIVCAIKNKYKFQGKKIGLGVLGIVISYAIIFVFMMAYVSETPSGMSNSEAYEDMVRLASGFKIFDILVYIGMIFGYGYLSGAKGISLIADREKEVCTALLFGSLGAIPLLLYVASCF